MRSRTVISIVRANCWRRRPNGTVRYVMYSVAYMLDAAARLAHARNDDLLAATLLGAADHRRDIIGVAVWGSQLARREALLAEVRAAVGEDAYAAAYRDGCRLDYEAALDAGLRAG
ncbi:MAG: hypothetical protein U0W40_06960 [Acidimicrobiia bacterium]